MWVVLAFGSAFFAGITAILAKCGIKNTDSNLATAIRTVVVLIFSWLMVFIVGSQRTIAEISAKTWLFLALSGLATGASWMCYFKAMQLGDVNKVTPIDKSSTVLTIILAVVILGEAVTVSKALGAAAIGIGTWLMIQKKQGEQRTPSDSRWMIYAVLSAVFASLTSILAKIGIQGVESSLGTAIRTVVVVGMAWLVVFVRGKQREIKRIEKPSWMYLILSGMATGASWLCYYRALKDGPASVVVPIDKLSIILTVVFSFIFLHERLTSKALAGLALIVAGTLVLLI
ncbi:MAG: EamA family transporter [Chloroflexi bacterium]|nr:EamA family transporter [Chloroflexota bacterium]